MNTMRKIYHKNPILCVDILKVHLLFLVLVQYTTKFLGLMTEGTIECPNWNLKNILKEVLYITKQLLNKAINLPALRCASGSKLTAALYMKTYHV